MESTVEPRWRGANRRFYEAHQDREKERSRNYYHANKEARAEYQKKWRAKNRDKVNEQRRLWELNNPEKAQEYRSRQTLKSRCKRRGISVEQYHAMLTAQGGVCKICKTSDTGTRADWHIDHCHATGRVRGLLCHHCNTALGHVEDRVEVLKAMIAYLKGE